MIMSSLKTPKVSIAIPAYKATFLKEAINSVLSQTFQDLELIIVNDNSPEDLTSIVELSQDTRIRYYINPINIGGKDPVANWNKCLSYAQGEFFALLCDDDLYEPTFVEEMLALAEKFPQTNVFRSRVKIIDSQGKTKDVYPSSPEFETMENYMLDKECGYRRQTISEFLYRREHIIKVGGYYPLPYAWCADDASCFRFSKEGGIASSLKFLVSFRMSGVNISGSKKGIVEKIHAERMMTKFIQTILKESDSINYDLIMEARNKLYVGKMPMYLGMATCRDIIFLFKHRKEDSYMIPNRCFAKSIVIRIITIGKRCRRIM